MKKNIFLPVFLLITSLTLSNLAYAQLTRKAPYLIYTGVNTEMQALWQLNSTNNCTIEWGTDLTYSLGNVQTSQYGSDHQHSYTIQDLTPGTKYYYRVTVNQEIYTGSFYSAPDASATAIKFFAYGDTRTNPADHDPVAEEMVTTYLGDESYQTIVISMGDLINNGNAEADWDNQFFDPAYPNIQGMLATLPYLSCIGNHEGTGVLFTKYFPYSFEAGRYWSFDYGPAHFVVVDQYTSYVTGSAQLNWIENDLATTSKIWKFIYLHEPGWSAAGGHSNNTSVQNYIQPLCLQYGVSIVFAGHNHYYARAEVNNVAHITTGGGGAPLGTPDLGSPNLITATSAHHFCKVEIDNEMLFFTVVSPDGNTIDAFTIENPLPVELVSFTASVRNNQVLLKWVTQTEVNNYGFEIERSQMANLLDGKAGVKDQALDKWDVLGFVQGHGNSNSPKDYFFIDGNVTAGKHSYRLKQIDTDGQFEYSKVIEVNLGSPQKFQLSQNYPNPFNPSTTISFSLQQSGNVKLTVYNLLGEQVVVLVNGFKEAGIYTLNYNAENLNSGLYIYKIVVNGFIQSRKMLLLK